MLELTKTTKSKLHQLLAATDSPNQQGKCFRIVPKDEKFLTLKLAKPQPSDMVFEYEGDTILALPKALQPFFQDRSLDMDKNGQLRLI